MKNLLIFLIAITVFSMLSLDAFAGGRGRSSGSSYRSHDGKSSISGRYNNSYKSSSKKPTYNIGGTKYITGETYKSTGLPKVDRSSSNRQKFLKSRGYEKTPPGYEVDHITPLSKGGADEPYNMQLIPKELHDIKTGNKR